MSKFVRGAIIAISIILWIVNYTSEVQGKIKYSILPELSKKLGKLTPEEEWVIEELAENEMADFKDKQNRRIRGPFLAALLTNKFPGVVVPQHGVLIQRAIIIDTLDLEFAEISHRVRLSDCVFEGDVKLKNSLFKKSLEFDGAVFQKESDFGGMKVEIDLFFLKAKFANRDQKANFNGLKAGNTASFKEAMFYGEVNFVGGRIGGQFQMNGAQFLNEGKEANFNGLKVEKTVFFLKAKFTGPSDFGGAHLGGQFAVNEAEFLNDVNFNSIKIKEGAFFNKVKFNGSVNFGSADIGNQFEANEAEFLNEKEKVNFNGIKIEGGAFFNKSKFKGPVDFGVANINRFEATEAEFLNRKEKVNFNSIKIKESAFFHETEFYGEVDFTAAVIGEHFQANRVKFKNESHKAAFRFITIGHTASFFRGIFQGGVTFSSANIGNFIANEAKFLGTAEVSLNNITIGHDIQLEGTVFKGATDFISAKISGHLMAGGAAFENFAQIQFFNIKVGGNVYLNGNNVFRGPVIFRMARIDGALFGNGAIFDGSADFTAIKVGLNASFDKAEFKRDGTFNMAEIHGQFTAGAAKFGWDADFTGMKVGAGALFDKTEFRGNVDFSDANYGDLTIKGSTKLPFTPKLSLTRTVVNRKLEIENLRIGELQASYLQAKGATVFIHDDIKYLVDLRCANFEKVEFNNVSWPEISTAKQADGRGWEGLDPYERKRSLQMEGISPYEQTRKQKSAIRIEGMTYNTIEINPSDPAEERRVGVKNPLELLEKSEYFSPNYIQLESYYQRIGQKELADEIYILGNRREWQQHSGWGLQRWAILILWDWLAGYGRKPFRVLIIGLLIILFGAAFVFKPEDLVEVKWPSRWKDYKRHKYISRFLLSLEQFVPMVDLGMGKYWKPSNIPTYVMFYVYFHRFCGWLFIPICLAAIYTRFK